VLADLCYLGRVDELVARVARKLGYKVVASPKVGKASTVEGVRFIPRIEVRRGSLQEHESGEGVKVLIVESKEDLKSYTRLLGKVDSARVVFDSLGDVSKDFIRRIIGLGAPIELEFSEVVEKVQSGRPLDYYLLLLRLYARRKIKVYACSGATSPSDMVHPTAMFSLLTVLGLPEELALKAVLKTPVEMVANATH
jgi:hypothetical protein